MRIRRAIEAMKPYVPGRSIESVREEYGLDDLVKLNQNENPLGPSPRAVEAATEAMRHANIYPDGTAPALRERIARLWNVEPGWVLAGNGSDEIFRLLAEVCLEAGDRVVVPRPSFGGYPLVSQLMGAQLEAVPLRDWAMDVEEMARCAARTDAALVFLCRPNSPTGGVFSEDRLRGAMEIIRPSTIVVLDEAYAEFDETPFDSRALLLDYPNLVVTRTFSKLYGMAAFRLGYGIMHPALLEPLLRARDPFSMNGPAIAAGIAALDDREHVNRTLQLVWEGKRSLYALFDRLELEYVLTQANFVLFDAGRPACVVADDLLRRGVLIRDCTSFGLPHHLRVTVGTPEENARFAESLEEVLS